MKIITLLLATSLLFACSDSDKYTEKQRNSPPQIMIDTDNRMANITSAIPQPQKVAVLSEKTDSDQSLRTVEYYKSHAEELNKKLWECANFPQISEEQYKNCLNAQRSLKESS